MTEAVAKRSARKPKKGAYDQKKPAAKIVAKFGGLARFCEACSEIESEFKWSPSTAYRWLQKGFFPRERESVIKQAAEANGFEIEDGEFSA